MFEKKLSNSFTATVCQGIMKAASLPLPSPSDEKEDSMNGISRLNRRYSTSDMMSMYGLTNNGLFFYEKKGVIAPERVPENQYRVFTMRECSRLFLARMYGKCGLSVDESAVAVDYIEAKELTALYARRREALAQEARYNLAAARELKRNEALLFRILSGEDVFLVQNSPAMLRLEMRRRKDDRPGAAPENSRDFQEWLNYLPFASASICAMHSSLQSGGEVEYNLGFIAELETLQKLNIRPQSACALLPPRRCLYAVIAGSDTDFHTPDRFAPALKEIEQLGLTLSGDAFTRMIGVFDAGSGMLRYDEAWFPVEEPQ